MGKLGIYLAMLGVVLVGLHFAGLLEGATSVLLNLMLNPTNFELSQLFTSFTGILTVGGLLAGGVALGFAVAGKPDIGFRIFITDALIVIGFDIYNLFNILNAAGGISSFLAVVLISPMVILFVLTVIEWVTGMQS